MVTFGEIRNELDKISSAIQSKPRLRGYERRKKLAEKVLTCPKCHKTDIWVYEVIEAESQHRVTDGMWRHEYDNNEYGYCIRMQCKCENCGHEWTSHRGLSFNNYYLSENKK